ncbi:MAG TPA: DUF3153 domain-containing protein [Synechococcales cyanobacterium M55_K2018_004]|nr:DUF3153 domain-containing protein [Synechococcales cyanobacterium M55_K2018_004]
MSSFLLPLLLLLTLLLTGCIQSDVGVYYISQTQGEIVQHLRLSDRLNLQDPAVQHWLATLEERSRQLGGHTQYLRADELQVTIPFTKGQDLSTKFNRFFSPVESATEGTLQPIFPPLPRLETHLQVSERNLLLVQRNHLSLDVDLRPLAVRSPDGTVLLSAGNLLDLQFHLTTPWGAQFAQGSLPPIEVKPAEAEDTSNTTSRRERQLTWNLKPGELNHLEASFWVPSPLGLGSVAIAFYVILGSTLRAFLFSRKPISEKAPPRV